MIDNQLEIIWSVIRISGKYTESLVIYVLENQIFAVQSNWQRWITRYLLTPQIQLESEIKNRKCMSVDRAHEKYYLNIDSSLIFYGRINWYAINRLESKLHSTFP